MKRLLPIFATVLLSALAFSSGACVVSGRVHTGVYAETPAMVQLDSGVYVVQDYDQPVFYDSDYYWRYEGGVWYRYGYYDHGWIRVETVPVRIRTIHHPYAYVHYRGDGGVRVYDHRGPEGRPAVVDHRDNGWHRGEERREERREERPRVEDHREQRQERHEERREQRREERHEDRHEDRGRVRDHRH